MTGRIPPETPLAAALRVIGESSEVQVRRYVYVVDKDHVAHRREIFVKDVPDDSFIIKDDDFIVGKGVGAGERIVVDGVGQVNDGDKVE
jgi:membrane fusion protein, multidrug efflux system